MKDGFLKAAALSPALRVADCAYNVRQITEALRKAAARGMKLAVFPEFCLTGYTCGDLFLQRTLQTGALEGLNTLLEASRELDLVALVGLPLSVHGKLYNCAAVLCRGQLLGIIGAVRHPQGGGEGGCFQKTIFHRRISHPVFHSYLQIPAVSIVYHKPLQTESDSLVKEL